MNERPTPYDDVNALLLLLLRRVQAILGGELIGLYLYGSLSLGDFDPDSSDVDFLFVTEGELSGEPLETLRAMHAEIAASGMRYSGKLEGSYIPDAALRRYDPNNAMHPTIGVDWAFGVGQHGMNWILERHIVRERGIVVFGPPPKTLIDPVLRGDMQAAVCSMLRDFWQQQLDSPAWLEPRDYQAFAVLTMCRALYTLSEGDVVSKPQAAAWALQVLDPRWHWLVEQAFAWRHQHERENLSETMKFIRFAIAQADVWCGSH